MSNFKSLRIPKICVEPFSRFRVHVHEGGLKRDVSGWQLQLACLTTAGEGVCRKRRFEGYLSLALLLFPFLQSQSLTPQTLSVVAIEID